MLGICTHTLRKCLILIIASVLTTSISLADNNTRLSCFHLPPCWRAVMSLGLGAAISSQIGKSQSFPVITNPGINEFFSYSANRSSQASSLFDGFLGAEWTYYPWALQMGLGFKQAWNWEVHGSVLQGVDLLSANMYTYHYNILTRQVLAEAKLLYHWIECYHPYVLIGAGRAYNESEGFATGAPKSIPTRLYKDKMQRTFTYTVGLGIDVNVLDYVRFGLGYRFADLGQVELGNARIGSTNVMGKLSQTHVYASEILGHVTILIA